MTEDTVEVTFSIDEQAVEFAKELDDDGLIGLIDLFEDLKLLFVELRENGPVEREDLAQKMGEQTSLHSASWPGVFDALHDAGWIGVVEGQQTGFVLNTESGDSDDSGVTML
ncbi:MULTISPECIES: hypothetical protein [Halobacteriales]|jgi:hypothetical protein|uniref:hypothetical protein n=1 Tax=Halobacteriales TaxID=2235 RepID=UPI001E5C346A|nr:hypothetical protein [Halobacterium noricense]UHH27056.1 hypothetical protein LT974_17395 [Halobacterium noricense]